MRNFLAVAACVAAYSGASAQEVPSVALDGQLLSDGGRAKRELQVRVSVGRLQDKLRDPDSLIVEKILTTRDAKIVCVWYRARNGFGGMDRTLMAFVGDLAFNADQAGAVSCGEAVIDMGYAAKRSFPDGKR